MRIPDYEKCIISTIFNYPNGNENIPQRIVSELEPNRFGEQPNKLIYQSVVRLVLKDEVPNTVNVATELKSDIETIGGIEYLESLKGFLGIVGLSSFDGFEKWVQIIDNAGRLRHLKTVSSSYAKRLEDLESVVVSNNNIDAYISNFFEEANTGISSLRTTYKPFSVAVDAAVRYVEALEKGVVADIILTGWPSLEKYLIPRPYSFGIIIGMSSMGKTQFALQVAYGAAKQIYDRKEKGVVSINSLETTGKNLALRLGYMLARVDSQLLATGQVSTQDRERLLEKLDQLYSLPIEYDDNPAITTDQLTWQAIAQNLKSKRVLSILDYSELFGDKHKDNEELRLSNIARNIKKISSRTGSCEVMLSQFNELHDKHKIGGRKSRYSRAIFDAAEWYLEVWNPVEMRNKGIDFQTPDGKNDGLSYALIHKNKEYKTGEVTFEWIPEYGTFRDTACDMGLNYQESVFEDEGDGYF